VQGFEMNESMNQKMLEIALILEDYSDIIHSDNTIQDYVFKVTAKFYETGNDITETELDTLIKMLKTKVDEYVKTKGN
jgi:hypothetical protein